MKTKYSDISSWNSNFNVLFKQIFSDSHFRGFVCLFVFTEESYEFFLHVQMLAICISSDARVPVFPSLRNFFN